MGYLDTLPPKKATQSSSPSLLLGDLPPKKDGIITTALKTIPATAETTAAIATGIPASLLGVGAGVVGTAMGGAKQGREWEQGVSDFFTYKPKMEMAKQSMEIVGKGMELANYPAKKLGEATEKVTGSPELGYAAEKGGEVLIDTLTGKLLHGAGKRLSNSPEYYNPKLSQVLDDTRKAEAADAPLQYRDKLLTEAEQRPIGLPDVPPQRRLELVEAERDAAIIKHAEELEQKAKADKYWMTEKVLGKEPTPRFLDALPPKEKASVVTPEQTPFNMDEARRINQERFGNNKPTIEIPSQTLASRNNNPGNLRFANQEGAIPGDKGFAKFETPEDGYVALQNQIELDKGRGHTVESFINKYAPPVENNTSAYTKSVAEKAGVSPKTPLKEVSTNLLAKEIARIESGTKVSGILPEQEALLKKVFKSPEAIERTLDSFRTRGVELPPSKIKPSGNGYRLEFMEGDALALGKAVEPPKQSFLSNDALDWLTEDEPITPARTRKAVTLDMMGGQQLFEGLGDVGKAIKEWYSPSDRLVVPPHFRTSFMRPEVEQRFQSAKDTRLPPWAQRTVKKALDLSHNFTRHFVDLNTKDPLQAQAAEIFRQHEASFDASQALTKQYVKQVTMGLDKERHDIFTKNVVLKSILDDVDNGTLPADSALQFGLNNADELRAEVANFEGLAQSDPKLSAQLAKRQAFMGDLQNSLIKSGIISPENAANKNYFHHLILDHMNIDDLDGNWQIGRNGSIKDFSTDYVLAEYKVVSEALFKLRAKQTMEALKQFDIRDKLVKQYGADWEQHIPEGYVKHNAEQSKFLKEMYTVPDGVMERLVKGSLSAEDAWTNGRISRQLVQGADKPSWIVPEGIAKTMQKVFDDKKLDEGLAKFSYQIMNQWKRWTLLNPLRFVRYSLNNAVGDLDVAWAHDPKIVTKYSKGAMADLYKFMGNKELPAALQAEIEDSLYRGVLNSGISGIEIPTVAYKLGLEMLAGKDVNMVKKLGKKYWDYAEYANTLRENSLRLASYRYFKDKLARGEQTYAASQRFEINALNVADQAAKLSRELMGDYGNTSHFSGIASKHLMPFYRWMEINMPRYWRMLKNLPHEGNGSIGRVGLVGAKKTAMTAAKFALTANTLFGAVNIWNRTQYPEEEKEFNTEFGRNQQHIILGRNPDGSIKSFRFQGALSDALGVFGLNDLVDDYNDIKEGKATIEDKVKEIPGNLGKRYFDAARPLEKGAVEAMSGWSYYPDPTNPRPIRDGVEHALKTVSLDLPYRHAMGKPTRESFGKEVFNTVRGIQNTDTGENSYYKTKAIVSAYREKLGMPEKGSGGKPTDKSNTLYYAKQALKYGDKETAKRYIKEYVTEHGGTSKGLKKSLDAAHPLSGINKSDWKGFLMQLPPDERDVVKRGLKWYMSTYKGTKQNGK